MKASDVSLSGMMLHSSAESMGALRVGDELLFGFTDPASKDQFRLRAALRWKRRGIMRLLGAWAFGVEFTGTPEEDVRRLLDPAAKASAPLP